VSPTMLGLSKFSGLAPNAWAVSGGTALFAVPSARRPVLAGEPLPLRLARNLAALPTLITTGGYAYAAIALDELVKFYTERMAMPRATSGETNHPLWRPRSSKLPSPRWGSGKCGLADLGSPRLRRSDPRLHAAAPVGAFALRQVGARAKRRRQAASLQEWHYRSKGQSRLRAAPQRGSAA
jgi:hypothetical protein